MATSSSYYINGPSLGSSTAVFLDATLTTLAPDGFYSDSVISREQVGGALLPQQDCDCGGIPVSYNCVDGSCVDPGDGTGTYSTLSECLILCGAISSIVTNVTSSTHNTLGEYFADASVDVDVAVTVDTTFVVYVTASLVGIVPVTVIIYTGNTSGSGSQSVGTTNIGVSTGNCIYSCDNTSVDFSSFSCA